MRNFILLVSAGAVVFLAVLAFSGVTAQGQYCEYERVFETDYSRAQRLGGCDA